MISTDSIAYRLIQQFGVFTAFYTYTIWLLCMIEFEFCRSFILTVIVPPVLYFVLGYCLEKTSDCLCRREKQ